MKAIGGNSGYIGYSESVRSYNAKKDGKYPKTVFKKEYSITEKKFKELEERGVISISEWHHTSKFGNKTDFWAVNDFVLFYLFDREKSEVGADIFYHGTLINFFCLYVSFFFPPDIFLSFSFSFFPSFFLFSF